MIAALVAVRCDGKDCASELIFEGALVPAGEIRFAGWLTVASPLAERPPGAPTPETKRTEHYCPLCQEADKP